MSAGGDINYQMAIAEAKRQEGERWRARAKRWNVAERRVFISYSGGDRAIADDVRTRLQARQIPDFAFEHDMAPGDEIVVRIKAEIDLSSHIVVVATRESMGVKPHWLSYELAFGTRTRRPCLRSFWTRVSTCRTRSADTAMCEAGRNSSATSTNRSSIQPWSRTF